MGEDESKKTDAKKETIEEIMRERSRIDQIIKQKYRKKMTILFSDVCGFTTYTETKGDLSSRAWIQQHNDIVLPLIKNHDGKILKIMGDGVLSSFADTLLAVKASVAIQKSLVNYNKSTDPEDEIHVSMGINTGEILVDDEDIAGDVVNVASRIESKADRDQILISKSTYEEVRGSEDILCRLYGNVSVKGKAKPLELYQVVWQDEDIILSSEPRVRSDEKIEKRKTVSHLKILQLEGV